MEEVFIAVMERLAAEMPELSLIDEDYGQIEMSAENDSYPLTFPCALIGETDSLWADVGTSYQKGDCSITVKLALDCYEDTSYSSGTYQSVRGRQKLAHKLYRSLQGLRCSGNATPLTRVKRSGYMMPGLIKIYELQFSFKLVEGR